MWAAACPLAQVAQEQGKVRASAEGKVMQGRSFHRHEHGSQRAEEAWQSSLGRGVMGKKVDSGQTHEGLGDRSVILKKAPGPSQAG